MELGKDFIQRTDHNLKFIYISIDCETRLQLNYLIQLPMSWKRMNLRHEINFRFTFEVEGKRFLLQLIESKIERTVSIESAELNQLLKLR